MLSITTYYCWFLGLCSLSHVSVDLWSKGEPFSTSAISESDGEGGCVLLPLIGWGMGAYVIDHRTRKQMKDRRCWRRGIIVWKICVYSAMQNHRSIYNSGLYNHETHLCTQTHKMNMISFLFRNNPLPPPPPCITYNAKYKPLSLFPLILDAFYSPCPRLAAIPSFSPLCPIMDFSCDVRKKYLLLECIDCFNGREQRAKREEKEGTGDIEECTQSPLA